MEDEYYEKSIGDSASVEVKGTIITVIGDISSIDSQEVLTEILDDFHSSVISKSAKKVVFDMTKLDFISSSGIKAILNWFLKVKTLSEDKQYKVHFICDPEVTWHDVMLKPFTFIGPGILEIEKSNR